MRYLYHEDDIANFFGIDPPEEKPKPKPPRLFLGELIILPGRIAVKKNTGRVVSFTRKDGSKGMTKINSPAYVTWEHAASAALGKMGYPLIIDFPVNVQLRFYIDRDLNIDIGNAMEGPLDLLVKAGILQDDNYKIVASTNGSGIELDKLDPRTEILITRK